MENNEFTKVCIENRTCYDFDDITKFENLQFHNVLMDQKSHENVLIYDILYKNLIGAKSLRIKFNQVDGFIRIYDGS